MPIGEMHRKEKEDEELLADDEDEEKGDPKESPMVQEGEDGFYVIDGDEPWLDSGSALIVTFN